MNYTPHGLTAVDLQRELAQTLRGLFADTLLKSVDQEGMRAPHVFLQELPIPQDEYDAAFSELPYIIVHLSGGEIEDWDSSNAHTEITVELYFGIYNNDPDRSGHVELLNMIQRIENHFGICRRVHNFSVKPSFRWVLDEEDRHPYYFGAVSMTFDAPRTIKEDPFA